MSEKFGIDVSHYQKAISWSKVKDAGKDFAIIKCQYEAQSHRKDEYFEMNYKGAGDNMMSRGVYIFIASSSMRDPKGDAESLLKHLNGRALEYGIWLDYESDVLRAAGKKKIKELTHLYADTFRAAGYYTGIYCNKDWYMNVIPEEIIKSFDFWIARYPKNDVGDYRPGSSLKPSKDWASAWQYSSKGKVPGIEGNVDLDVDFDGIINLFAQTPFRKTNYEIAREVLDNKWGTKDTKPSRRELLTRAGYNYNEIQKIVTKLYYSEHH